MEQYKENILAVAEEPRRGGYMEFEGPLAALAGQISELEALRDTKDIDFSPEIRQLREELVKLTVKIYDNLSPWQTVQVARHPWRPQLKDYLNLMVQDFFELHGDRYFGDDRAIITGFGRIQREKVMIVGHNKGHEIGEKLACNFGCALPEGYRKALEKMKLAEKFGLPIVCMIDTPGAYAGIGAEERGQARAIATNLREMFRLRVPIIGVIIGEGGSGGALGIGVTDRMAVMQFAYYSVISPEGCAAILWKNREQAALAAAALKLTSGELMKLGVIDEVVPEPLGGAQRNVHEAVHNVEAYIVRALRDLKRSEIDDLIEERYHKFRQIGEVSVVGESNPSE